MEQMMYSSSETDTNQDKLITEREAARFLGYTHRAMQNWRHRGGGPAFVKVSARSIRYRMRDLIDWIDSKTVRNTSEYQS
jgi:predicted DNA-binding transcriptional regulator AlpA